MLKSPVVIKPVINAIPLTAEAREELLGSLFFDQLPHLGELFIPDDAFYIGTTPRKLATHMAKILCTWLGVKPGYIELTFISKIGHDIPDGKRYRIYIDVTTLADEFVLGGFLALELTRYVVEERGQIYLPGADQQTALLASASIMCGLGVAVMNGMCSAYNWFGYYGKCSTVPLLQHFPSHSYAQMTRNFLKQHLINPSGYAHCLTPWTSQRLGMPESKQSNHAIRDLNHRIKAKKLKLAGLLWLALLTIGVGGFTLFIRVRPVPLKLREAQQQAVMLGNLEHLCTDSLNYKRQYADSNDIQTERALGAEFLRCQSLRNQSHAAEQRVRQLSP